MNEQTVCLHADAQAHSQLLSQHIRDEIAAQSGWISFARYMELALYTPVLGYYAGGAEKLGPAGDFVTAPELTPLFAESLARQIVEIMAQCAPRILEFGAGSGRLAADLLATLDRLGSPPESYDILELSAELRHRQRRTLSSPSLPAVNWLDQLPEDFSGVILANEVLDALPVHRVRWQADGIFELGVSLNPDGDFEYQPRPASGPVLAEAERIAGETGLPSEYESELALAAPRWLTACAQRLRQGALLLIDYGWPQREFFHPQRRHGNLRCHFRHRAHDNPFFLPGQQDITASVDFTTLANAGEAAGLALYGYTSQGQFLVNCGLLSALSALPADSAARHQATAACHRLLLPQGMGEAFKVLAMGRGLTPPLLGFTSGDRSLRL